MKHDSEHILVEISGVSDDAVRNPFSACNRYSARQGMIGWCGHSHGTLEAAQKCARSKKLSKTLEVRYRAEKAPRIRSRRGGAQ